MTAAAFRRSVDVFLTRQMSAQQQSAALAEVARRGVAEIVASGRAPDRYRRYVDGIEGAPEDAVKPAGVIVYRFDYMADVAAFALEFLRERSPKGAAHDHTPFRDSFWLGLGGRFIRAQDFNPATMGTLDEIVIGNTQPYTRKVDVQLAGRTRLRFSVPAGLFDDAARAINGRFGNTVQAKRVYSIKFPGQYTLKSASGRSGTQSHLYRRLGGSPVESPALVITAR